MNILFFFRGEFRGESGRRRQLSSSRPMSSMGDYADLFTLLGLPKSDEGQVTPKTFHHVPNLYSQDSLRISDIMNKS